MNNNGTVVGSIPVDDAEPNAGIRWSPGNSEGVKISAPVGLAHYDKNNQSLIRYCYFSAINDQETIFGGVYTGGGFVASPFNLNPSPIVNAHWWTAVLGTPTALSFAHPINQDSNTAIYNWAGQMDYIARANSSGRYIGTTLIAGEPIPFGYQPLWITPGIESGMIDGQPVTSYPRDINEAGIVVATNHDYTAMVISNPDGSSSVIEGADPVAINDHVRQSVSPQGGAVRTLAPEIVGYLGNDLALWESSSDGTEYVYFRLQDLAVGTPGWELWRVNDINDHGMIVGMGFYSDPSNPQAQSENRGFVLVPLELVVDGNRDGQMSLTDSAVYAQDRTSEQKPYRFWLNDDDDTDIIIGEGGEPLEPTEAETVPAPRPDYERHKIVSKRNLEDFTRLWISIGDVEASLASGSMQIALKWKAIDSGSPAINIYPSADGDGSDSYITDSDAAGAQIVGIFNDAIRDKNNNQTVDSTGVFTFKPDYWNGANANGGKKCLLLEGASEGKGQLQVILLDSNGNQIAEGGTVWLDLKNIKKMYQRYDISGQGQWPTVAFDAAPDEADQAILFVHGWKTSPDGASNYAETMFKRVWWRGFKGRFAAVRWNTYWSDTFEDIPLIGETVDAYLSRYDDSEHNAWYAGQALMTIVNGFSKSDKSMIAHSMGNVVCSSAALSGLQVDHYALLQGAIPASCYDNNSDLQQAPQSRTYPTGNVYLWSSVTPDDDPGVITQALAYRSRLIGIGTDLTNFYLPGDRATVYAWEFNNAFKPDSGFFYSRDEVDGSRLWKNEGGIRRTLTDPFESMPYADQSWSKCVGAEGRTSGAISSSVDLSSQLFSLPDDTTGFNDDHSAEFSRSIQHLKPFYRSLLNALAVPQNP